jgi:putative FmdB family regulatory protein
MPTYSYYCNKCNSYFELFFYIKDYIPNPKCECGSKNTERDYIQDVSSIMGSVKKSDSELKTIGDLANRNRDRMSEDQVEALHIKHNSYKETASEKELPKGMSRIKKPKQKPKWT